MGGAASGKFTVKSCGNAHAWCTVCRPEQRDKLRKPKPPRKPSDKPCRNCGKCNDCIGLSAPAGMKICRKCGETKTLAEFPQRADTGGYRNQCRACRHGGAMEPGACERCGARFWSYRGEHRLCARHRPSAPVACAGCGSPFVRSVQLRRYCSEDCRDASLREKREAAYRALRLEALTAYSSGPVLCCNCCGETTYQFLALDHINGGGRRQIKELGGGGYWSWLRRNHYPPGYQILCHNCNMGRKVNGGVCPHKELVLAVAG